MGLLRICGIDEAGRGAVIGPMVVAGVLVDQSRVGELVELGVRDSKELTPGIRAELSKLIREIAERVEIMVVDARIVDESTRRSGAGGINELEAKIIAKLIDRLKPDAAYVDLPSTKYHDFRAMIECHAGHKCSLILEHKADQKYPVVSAASIIAKHERDMIVERLKAELGDFGSGYPSDPKTRSFLLQALRRGEVQRDHIRLTWRTISKLAQRRLDEF
ncbi:MAG: ribonuclease HII [Nitrososphaerota archaeon]